MKIHFHESSNQVSWQDSKTKLAPVFFSDFLELLWEKNKLLPKKSNRDNRYKLSAFWRN